MKGFIDTNIFVYATYSKFPQFEKAISFLKNCIHDRRDSWCLGWNVIYEYLRVVTHPGLFEGETIGFLKAVENVEKFCSASNVEILGETEVHFSFLKNDAKKHTGLVGNILHDFHSVVLMKEHDVGRIYTADTDFHRFSEISVVNPLQK